MAYQEGVRKKVSDFEVSFIFESSTGIWDLNRRKPILMYGKHFSSSAINEIICSVPTCQKTWKSFCSFFFFLIPRGRHILAALSGPFTVIRKNLLEHFVAKQEIREFRVLLVQRI